MLERKENKDYRKNASRNDVTAWTNPGLCLSRLRHEQEAIACFEKVRELACFVTVRDIVR